MGVTLWMVTGLAAFLVARIIPPLRPPSWKADLLVALAAALAAGVAATIFDFGGWAAPDWRAGLFCFLSSFALLGAVRLLRGGGSVKM